MELSSHGEGEIPIPSGEDGCGEFMPSGEEGSIEALTCSACNCHRNFHRKEIEAHHDNDQLLIHPCDTFYPPHFTNNKTRKLILGHHKTIVHAPQPLAYPTVPGAGHHQQQQQLVKKRFRTKFTAEQKEKMLNFAESWLEDTKARRECRATILPRDWNQEESPQGLDA